jgi:Domain of unknown function (DUF4145)
MFGNTKPKPKGARDEILPEENEGLPDSSRPSGLCPRCGKQSSFEKAGSLPVTFDYETYTQGQDGISRHDATDVVTSLICRHCRQGVVVVEEQWVGDHPKRKGRFGGVISYRGIHWWPLPDTKRSPDVPNEIAGAFAESITALSANCPRASAAMARRTLEAITVERGETKGTLAERLNALGTKGILHPTLSDWAKEVRLVGNIGAHFDPIQQVSMEDARQLVDFIRELLKYLYELPAELARRRSPQP